MEFIEAPAFTQWLPRYLIDDEYRALQLHLARDPEAGKVMPVPAGSESCGGQTADGARASEAVFASSTTTLRQLRNFG